MWVARQVCYCAHAVSEFKTVTINSGLFGTATVNRSSCLPLSSSSDCRPRCMSMVEFPIGSAQTART